MKKTYLCLWICLVWILGPKVQGQQLKEAEKNTLSFQDFAFEISNYRDPFIPLIGGGTYDEQAVKGKLKLEGILWHPVNPLVVINGEILESGDGIIGAVVERIEKGTVYLSCNDKTFSLVLWEMEGTKR